MRAKIGVMGAKRVVEEGIAGKKKNVIFECHYIIVIHDGSPLVAKGQTVHIYAQNGAALGSL